MRFWIVALTGIALASIVAGGMVLDYRRPAPPPPAGVATSTPLPSPALAPPVPMPSPSDATVPPPAVPSPPRLAQAPDLPTVEVSPRPEHVVPDHDSAPPRPVILKDGDRSADVAPRGSPRVAARQAPSLPPQSPAVTINGKARLGEGVSLMVEGRAVALFGVAAPKPGDRCAVSTRLTPRACSEVAREVLASRLDVHGTVSCRLPPGRRGPRAAVCRDSTGIDLGGFLVAQGFGLADAAQSDDYVASESVAASLHRGLWRFR